MTATLPPSERVHGGELHEPHMFRRWLVLGGAIAAVMVAVAAYLYFDGPSADPACNVLHDGPPGLDSIVWDNGITAGGATSWWHVFTDGIEHADAATRVAIAEAVAADTAGYEHHIADLNGAERAAFDQLRTVAIGLDRSAPDRVDPETVAALAVVHAIPGEHSCDPHMVL